VDIASRVKVSVHFALEEARNSEHAASFVFKVAPGTVNSQEPIVKGVAIGEGWRRPLFPRLLVAA
jgi:hypothetical protein